MTNLKIDTEFRDLIPPLSKEEYSGLESSIKSEGCRDSIVTWNSTIIDGHNRYEICTKNNLPFKTHEMNFSDRDTVIDWIYSNQLGRRNLTDTMRTVLIGRQYSHRKKQGRRTDLTSGQNDHKLEAVKIAEEQGVSEKTVRRAEELAEAVTTIRDIVGPEAEKAILNETVKVTNKEIITKAEELKELKESAPEEIIEIKASIQGSGIKNSALFTSDSPEWYTPPEIIESVFNVLRVIELDPCSDGKTIPATTHYTKEDDGLSKTWKGTVYMNPPYGNEIKEWVKKLLSEWEVGNVTEAIALVPARTDTEWFSLLDANPWCAVRGRLKFSGNKNSAPFPSAIFYLCRKEDIIGIEDFARVFRNHGTVFQRL